MINEGSGRKRSALALVFSCNERARERGDHVHLLRPLGTAGNMSAPSMNARTHRHSAIRTSSQSFDASFRTIRIFTMKTFSDRRVVRVESIEFAGVWTDAGNHNGGCLGGNTSVSFSPRYRLQICSVMYAEFISREVNAVRMPKRQQGRRER